MIKVNHISSPLLDISLGIRLPDNLIIGFDDKSAVLGRTGKFNAESNSIFKRGLWKRSHSQSSLAPAGISKILNLAS